MKISSAPASTLSQVLAQGAEMDAAITLDATNTRDIGSTSAGLRALYSRAVTADSPASGAGIDLTLSASAAFASSGAAGGDVVLVPGAGDGAGAVGRVIVRSPGGVAGTDQIDLYHDGTNGWIESQDGELFLRSTGGAIQLSTAGVTRLILNSSGLTISDTGSDLILGTTIGTRIGTATSQLLGFWGTAPVDQPAHIADPAGGSTVDAEARTAINAINALLAETGLSAAA